MTTVTVKASQTYEVKIGRGLLETVGQETAALLKGRQAAIVSDTNVAPLYLDRVQASLEGAGFQVCSFIVYPKEQLFGTSCRSHFVGSDYFTVNQSFCQ